jgi:ubiquinone/menaquinone biosynthesis C-methylase UbiE
MVNRDTLELNRRGWDAISSNYQAGTFISVDDIHYGPLGLGERSLRLLGDVAGKTAIEIGCGGGQNAIVLAKWGADVVGVDPSREQLKFARKLALQEGVKLRFEEGFAEDLGVFPNGTFDLAISAFAFDYVTDLDSALREAYRILAPGGMLVLCLSHPWFAAVGWYLAGDQDAKEIWDYASFPMEEEWDWTYPDGTKARMRDRFQTLAEIVNAVIQAGFELERIVEQAYEDIDDPETKERLPYVHKIDEGTREYEIGRKLPRTLILKATKRG